MGPGGTSDRPQCGLGLPGHLPLLIAARRLARPGNHRQMGADPLDPLPLDLAAIRLAVRFVPAMVGESDRAIAGRVGRHPMTSVDRARAG